MGTISKEQASTIQDIAIERLSKCLNCGNELQIPEDFTVKHTVNLETERMGNGSTPTIDLYCNECGLVHPVSTKVWPVS